jgi:5'-nucleotidase
LKILLVNDDGIDAPGMQALHDAVSFALAQQSDQLHEIVVVAPNCGRSECGHSVTTGRALTIESARAGWYSVDGTPVDCVRFALGKILPDADCVISGINAGANLGVDLLVSGTFAAAREAAIQGVPALAVSHYRRPEIPKTWDHAPRWLRPVFEEFLAEVLEGRLSPPPLWNVNLPAIDPNTELAVIRQCSVDPTPMTRNFSVESNSVVSRSDFHGRPRVHDSDVCLCFRGHLTISKLAANWW